MVFKIAWSIAIIFVTSYLVRAIFWILNYCFLLEISTALNGALCETLVHFQMIGAIFFLPVSFRSWTGFYLRSILKAMHPM